MIAVPLRPSLRRWLVEQHEADARTERRRAGELRGMATRAPDDYWREVYLESAAEADARAEAHEATARGWAGG